MSNVRLRTVRADDAEALAALLVELGHPASADEVLARLAVLRATGDDVVVAEEDGEVTGLAVMHAAPLLEQDEPFGLLTVLVVAERARGRGLGRSLVEDAERRARARGARRLLVFSGRGRRDAHSFYERLGFEDRTRVFRRDL